MTTLHVDTVHLETPDHPWARAWDVLSAERRAALRGSVVDRMDPADLAARLGRTVEDSERLVGSSLVAFRREVVLGAGPAGVDPERAEECGALVLRLVDRAEEPLTRAERRALAGHADTCPDWARAAGELLELDARLREGLVALTGAAATGTKAPRRSGRRAWVAVGAAATVVTAAGLVLGAPGGEEDLADAVVASPQAAAAEAPSGDEVADPGQPVLGGPRITSRAPLEDETSARPTGTPSSGSAEPADPDSPDAPPAAPSPATGVGTGGGQGAGEPRDPDEEREPEGPEEEPGAPPLDVAVDPGTGSVTVTIGLFGEPIVISTPALTRGG